MSNQSERIRLILDVMEGIKKQIEFSDAEGDKEKSRLLINQYVKSMGRLFSEFRKITKDNIGQIYLASQQSSEAGLQAINELDMLLDDLDQECNSKLKLN